MNDRTVYFISGVSGVGKTAVIPHLRTLLPRKFEVHDFDERGVPDGADHAWRISETRHWIELGQQKTSEDKTVVVCGFSNPAEIEENQRDFPELRIVIILLDAEDDKIESRLRARNEDPAVLADLERAVGPIEGFIANNTKYASILRETCKMHECPVVDTSHIEPREVAEQIAVLLR